MIKLSILLVCMGNTCRSPLAEGYFNSLLVENKLENVIYVDSAGTHPARENQPPSKQALYVAKQEKLKISHMRARTIDNNDFREFDYILVMDKDNYNNVKKLIPKKYLNKLQLITNYVKSDLEQIIDPYDQDQSEYNKTFVKIKNSVDGFFNYLLEQKLISAK